MQSHPVAPQPAPKPVSIDRATGAKAPEGFGDLVARTQASEPPKGSQASDAPRAKAEKPDQDGAPKGQEKSASAKETASGETDGKEQAQGQREEPSKGAGEQGDQNKDQAVAADAAQQVKGAIQIAGAAGEAAGRAGGATGAAVVSQTAAQATVAQGAAAAAAQAGQGATARPEATAQAQEKIASAQASTAALAAGTKAGALAQSATARDGTQAAQQSAARGETAPSQVPARGQPDVSGLAGRAAASESADEPGARGEKTGARTATGEARVSVETTGQRTAGQVTRGLNEALLAAQSQRAEPREAPLRAKVQSTDLREGRGSGELRMPDPMRKLEVAAKPAPQPLHGRGDGASQNANSASPTPAGAGVMGAGLAGSGASAGGLPGEGSGLSGISGAGSSTPGALSSTSAGTPQPSGQLAGGNLPPQTAQQAAMQVQRAFAQGQSQVRVQLTPAGLGSVDVRMEFQDDGVRVRISVERAETLDMMSKDARALERALNDAGVRTQDGGLSFDLKGGGRQHAQDQTDGADEAGTDAGAETEGDLEDQTASDQPRMTDGAGGVDLRV